MKKTKTWFRVILLMLAFCMLLSLCSCGSTASSSDTEDTSVATNTADDKEENTETESAEETISSSEPVYGGTLNIYCSSLGAYPGYEPATISICNYLVMYESLWVADWTDEDDAYLYLNLTDDNIMGQIAESWEIDEDAMTMTLTVQIHEGIYFQTLDEEYDYYGGRELTAADVKYSYDRLFGWDGAPTLEAGVVDWQSTLTMLDSVETDGDYTVIFNLNTASDSDIAIQSLMTAFVNIIGPEWDELTDDQKNDWHYACGTGPFILSDCVEGSSMTYVKNENYYGYDERYPENKLPYLDGFTFYWVEDNATLEAEFLASEIDLICANSNVFDFSEQAQIRASLDESEYNEWTLDNTSQIIVLNQWIEPLQSLEVRKALQYAINLEEIAEGYYDIEDGDWDIVSVFGKAMSGYSSADEWSEELLAEYTTYDPELAMELLEEAGYGDGFEIQLAYYPSSRDELLMLVQDYLSQVGVTLTLVPTSTAVEVSSLVCNVDNCEYICTSEFGLIDMSYCLATWRSGLFNYRLGFEDTCDTYVDALQNASTIAEAEEAAQALDLYVAENHYGLVISPVEEITFFATSDVGGYDGQMLYQYWNPTTIIARLWNATGG